MSSDLTIFNKKRRVGEKYCYSLFFTLNDFLKFTKVLSKKTRYRSVKHNLKLLLNNIKLNMKKLEEIYKESGLKDEILKESLEQAKCNLETEIENCKELIAKAKLSILQILEDTPFDSSSLLDDFEEQKVEEKKLELLLEIKKQLF
jgi:hypothetical protein